jgi:alpha-1,3-glucan synthase
VTASSSGSLFTALNFGAEGKWLAPDWLSNAYLVTSVLGGATVKSWVYRASIIQGTQQILLAALFYWARTASSSIRENANATSTKLTAIALPISALLWFVGIALSLSLPLYYRQRPGKIPAFYTALLRRPITAWFFITVVMQNYFLSIPYGRNWTYLWSSKYAPTWTIVLLIVLFFIILWMLVLAFFSRLSKAHPWIMPIFAIGLGAPRWAQMLWGTSSFGLWLPWFVGGPVGGALGGRAVWLWLGILDSLQGVGLGMMLLQTLTRTHFAGTIMMAQILGTLVMMLAKATAPTRDGPGDVFPDFSAGVGTALHGNYWFWVGLGAQLIIPVGFFKVFRKGQLSKP